jgi:hypothetical protein
MQLTISNVGDPGSMHNGGLENTIQILDMVLDNAAGHKLGAVGIAGAHNKRARLHKLQGLDVCS